MYCAVLCNTVPCCTSIGIQEWHSADPSPPADAAVQGKGNGNDKGKDKKVGDDGGDRERLNGVGSEIEEGAARLRVLKSSYLKNKTKNFILKKNKKKNRHARTHTQTHTYTHRLVRSFHDKNNII